MSNKRVKRVISNLNKQSTFDCLKAGLLRVIRPRNNKKTSDQITQKSTIEMYGLIQQATGHKNIKKQRGWDSNPR